MFQVLCSSLFCSSFSNLSHAKLNKGFQSVSAIVFFCFFDQSLDFLITHTDLYTGIDHAFTFFHCLKRFLKSLFFDFFKRCLCDHFCRQQPGQLVIYIIFIQNPRRKWDMLLLKLSINRNSTTTGRDHETSGSPFGAEVQCFQTKDRKIHY